MDHWRFVKLATVRNLHTSFIAEARNGAHFSVGEIKDTPAEALESAAMALHRELAPLIEKRQKVEPPPTTDDWEDLL